MKLKRRSWGSSAKTSLKRKLSKKKRVRCWPRTPVPPEIWTLTKCFSSQNKNLPPKKVSSCESSVRESDLTPGPPDSERAQEGRLREFPQRRPRACRHEASVAGILSKRRSYRRGGASENYVSVPPGTARQSGVGCALSQILRGGDEKASKVAIFHALISMSVE